LEENLGRPRSFDEEKALEIACRCFWSRGYEATSVRDLSETMGIACPSLYNAYGDKRALFIAALKQYCERSVSERFTPEPGKLGAAAVRRVIADIVARSLNDPERKGCFIVNTALEVAPHDEEVRSLIATHFERMRGFFQRNIEAAAAADPNLDVDPAGDAAHLVAVAVGLNVLARLSPDRRLLEAAAEQALRRFAALAPPNLEEAR
jgi:TetR/AcrR family transcriptional regulator, transcriptional repressor for nem operon